MESFPHGLKQEERLAPLSNCTVWSGGGQVPRRAEKERKKNNKEKALGSPIQLYRMVRGGSSSAKGGEQEKEDK